MYYLKLYDEGLLSFQMDNEFGFAIKDIKILSTKKNLFPIKLKENINKELLEDSLKYRKQWI